MKLNTTETIKLRELEVNCSKAFTYWYNQKTQESKDNYLWHVQEKLNFLAEMQERDNQLKALYEVTYSNLEEPAPALQDNEEIY